MTEFEKRDLIMQKSEIEILVSRNSATLTIRMVFRPLVSRNSATLTD